MTAAGYKVSVAEIMQIGIYYYLILNLDMIKCKWFFFNFKFRYDFYIIIYYSTYQYIKI